MIGFLRATARVIWFGFGVMYILSKYYIHASRHDKNIEYALELRYRFVQQMNRVFGIKTIQIGKRPDPNKIFLFVCNHRNLIDPVIVLKFLKAWPVAKAEVENYPFIGIGAKVTGVIFVKREDKSSRRNTRTAIAEGLNSEKSILIFPEGKVSAEEVTKEFHIGSFEVAEEEGFPVFPMVLEYRDRQRDYWVNGSLFKQFYAMFSNKQIETCISFGEPIYGESGEELMNKSKAWIDQEIRRIHKHWNQDISL